MTLPGSELLLVARTVGLPARLDRNAMIATVEKPVLMDALAADFNKIDLVEQTGSTNADLLDSGFTAGHPAGPVLRWAGHQTAGRGRRGAVWLDQPGGSLTFSIAFERHAWQALPTPLAAFSLVSGVVLADELTRFMPWLAGRLRLKWPNDILLDGQKAVGILSEAKAQGALERVVIGYGINLVTPGNVPAQPRSLVPVGLLQGDARWSDDESQHLIAAIAMALKSAYEQFCHDGFEPFRMRWDQIDAFASQWIELRENETVIASGQCCGVDSAGALKIESDGIIETFSIGVVSARPGQSPAAKK